MFLVERGPATMMSLSLLRPAGDPLSQSVRRDGNLQQPTGHVECDHVTILAPGEGTADGSFWCHMENAGAETGAAHTRIADPDHVNDALLGELLGNGNHSPLREAIAPTRATAGKDKHRTLADIE